MKTMKKGKIIPNGVALEKHENETVVFLTELGYDVELISPSKIKGETTPDMKINGVFWEMKAPKGQGKYLIQNTLHKALHQSKNIILDLRRIKMSQAEALARTKSEFELSKAIKRLWIITRKHELLDLEK